MSTFTKLPTSRFGRFAGLAALGFRSGKGLLTGSGESIANDAVKVLGSMRGIATKVGQMASYVDGLVPDQHREAFETAMSSLRSQAPRSSPEQVRARLLEELGAPLETFFSEFNDEPMASASIGQVHRARLKDGREVVVKVQHPGIEKAMEADLSNLEMFESLGSAMGARQFKTDEFVETMRQRFTEELDYRLEAKRMEIFRNAFRDAPKVHVPLVIKECSSQRVLTSEFAPGISFDDAVNASEEDRRGWALTLWYFAMGGLLEHGLLNSDPHPGNYIFQPDGHVTFIDFGCCEMLSSDHVDMFRGIFAGSVNGNDAEVRRHLVRLANLKPGRLGDATLKVAELMYEPVRHRGPYRITRDHVAQIVKTSTSLGAIAMAVPEKERFFCPPELLFVNRLQYGFMSIIARLDVALDYREAVFESLHFLRAA